jgi:hypothetical protein
MTVSNHRVEGEKMMEKWWKVLMAMALIIGLTLTLSDPIFSIDSKSNRATLRGLKGVGVLIEKLPQEVEKEGLNRDQLQVAVESRLRQAGIRVLTKEESFKTPEEPYLYININVNIAKTESEIYPYSIDLLFIQRVSLLRNPNLTAYAVTWSKGGVGSIEKTIVGELKETVEEMVDTFISAYVEENPK